MIDDGHGENTVENAVTMPGRNGGTLRRGGIARAGPGRPRTAVRNMLVEEFAEQIPELKKDLKAGKITRLEFATLCARYGLGTTITETDTEGHDVIRVVREPRSLNGNGHG